jgi:putative chitinase
LQLTGRSNYADASAALNVDLIQRPELLVVAGCAARCAAWFWASRGLNALADDNSDDDDLEDFTEITRRVNGGTVGLQARLSLMLAVENHLA